jgi:cytochrome c553
MDNTEKYCPACGEIKAVGMFHNNKRTKDGFAAYCKSCKASQDKNRRSTPKGKIRAYLDQKLWYQANKNKKHKINKRAMEKLKVENPERIKQYTAKYNEKKRAQLMRQILSAHKETLWEKYRR